MRLLFFVTLLYAQETEPVIEPVVQSDTSIQETVIASPEVVKSAANRFQFIFQSALQCLEGGKSENFPKTQKNKNIAALWIRAAFHDGGTWSPGTENPAGLDSSLLSFLNEPENAGLEASMAPNTLKNSDIAMRITNSDKIALAAQVAVGSCGGPRFGFKSGRRDSANATSPHGLIPPGDSTLAQSLPHFKRMGWNNEDIVALVTGSHTMGGVHGENSPDITKEEFIPFDDTAGIFDNHVFKFTLQGKCAIQLDCDIANDPELRPIVQRFADDQDAFFKQYEISFQKLLSQTTSMLGPDQFLSLNTISEKDFKDTKQPPLNFKGDTEVVSITGKRSNEKKIAIIVAFIVVVTLIIVFALFKMRQRKKFSSRATIPRVVKKQNNVEYLLEDLLPETPSLLYSTYRSYKIVRNDEIELYVDDVIAVKEWDQSGWAYGNNITTGKKGFFPLICLVSPSFAGIKYDIPPRDEKSTLGVFDEENESINQDSVTINESTGPQKEVRFLEDQISQPSYSLDLPDFGGSFAVEVDSPNTKSSQPELLDPNFEGDDSIIEPVNVEGQENGTESK